MNPNNASESLFRINIDPVTKQLFVDDLDNWSDNVIDSGKLSSIFKLKVYTQGGILQKTLNIKGTDKLKTVLRRINGYKYNENDRIELWSTTPENIKVIGNLTGNDGSEDYTDGINDADYMKNVRFEIGSEALKYIYTVSFAHPLPTHTQSSWNSGMSPALSVGLHHEMGMASQDPAAR